MSRFSPAFNVCSVKQKQLIFWKIDADLQRRHVVARDAVSLARGQIDGAIVDGDDLAEPRPRSKSRSGSKRHGRPAPTLASKRTVILRSEHLGGRRRSRPGWCRRSRWCGRTSRRAAPRHRPCRPCRPRTQPRCRRPRGRGGGCGAAGRDLSSLTTDGCRTPGPSLTTVTT